MRHRVRRDRWLTLADVSDRLAAFHAKLASLSRREQRRYIRRLLQRIERRDGERYTKRVGREVVVSLLGLESLLPYDPERVTGIEAKVVELGQKHRELHRQVNGHGARLRIVEQDQAAASKYLAYLAAKNAPQSDHN
jgi:hypothetical protein